MESVDTYEYASERHKTSKSNKNIEMLFITVWLRVRILNPLVFIVAHLQINRTKLNRMLFVSLFVVFYTRLSLFFLVYYIPFQCYYTGFNLFDLVFPHFLFILFQFWPLVLNMSFIANTFIGIAIIANVTM